jgi:hypothetical protein
MIEEVARVMVPRVMELVMRDSMEEHQRGLSLA